MSALVLDISVVLYFRNIPLYALSNDRGQFPWPSCVAAGRLAWPSCVAVLRGRFSS